VLSKATNTMTHFMGIDGGGSNVRVAITTSAMAICAQSHGPAVNPSSVGRAQSAASIQAAMHEALTAASMNPDQIAAVAIGVAGAPAAFAESWLRETVAAVIPHTLIVPSSDNEIALVGANGERFGVLLLAGTGSVAHGINATGEWVQVGGWGYLLGDEGSGFRLGIEAIKAVMQAFDGRGKPTCLTSKILAELQLASEWELIAWLYQPNETIIRRVAQLAPLILEIAATGDEVARTIIEINAQAMAEMGYAVIRRLALETPKIAFAGSILAHDNLLSRRLCELLGLSALPIPRYPPVVGAALLAKLVFDERKNGESNSLNS
jgi:glucosamine kinase